MGVCVCVSVTTITRDSLPQEGANVDFFSLYCIMRAAGVGRAGDSYGPQHGKPGVGRHPAWIQECTGCCTDGDEADIGQSESSEIRCTPAAAATTAATEFTSHRHSRGTSAAAFAVQTGPGEVLEFKSHIFPAWKVLESDLGPW